MRVVKKSLAVLLAAVIALSAVTIGYAEKSVNEGTEIRMIESYGTTHLLVFSNVYIASFETVNVYQRDESDEKTLILSLSARDNCNIYSDEPQETFKLTIPGTGIFVAQGKYTLELIAKETPPEGVKKENDFSIDFEYENIINPEIEKKVINYTVEKGKKTELSEIISLPEGYLSIYYISENRENAYVSFVEIEGSSITGTARGNTVLIVKDRLSDEIIAKINLKVIPEKPDNFFELLGSTFGIMGSDAFRALITVGETATVGIAGLFYSLLFPVIGILSFFGAILGF